MSLVPITEPPAFTACDISRFREAMSRIGAAVNIITLADESGWHGFTASAVCSVTDDPPTLLVCINRNSRSHGAAKLGRAICINTLASHQKSLSVSFAGRLEMRERFSSGNWKGRGTGAPVLEDSAVSCDCRIANIVQVGTHSVVFCVVQEIYMGNLGSNLIYFARHYHALSQESVG